MSLEQFTRWREDVETRKHLTFYHGDFDKSQSFQRVVTLDHTRAQKDQRTVEATLSTEAPYLRSFGYEVLDHGEKSVDLSRVEELEGLPLLWSHNAEQHIGVIENVRLYNKRLRGRLRFSESELGEEKWKDVQAGILRGISVGYTIADYKQETTSSGEPVATIRATRWTPFEASCCAIPADPGARIGRDFCRSIEAGAPISAVPMDLDQHRKELNLLHYVGQIEGVSEHPELTRAFEELYRLTAAKEFKEASVLAFHIHREAASLPDVVEQSNQKLTLKSDEPKEDRFMPFFSETQGARSAHINTEFPLGSNDSPADFSLCRAIALASGVPEALSRGGPELEIMQQTAKERGNRGGYSIPAEAFYRDITKGTSGGNLVGTDHLGSEYIPTLRDALITARMGARILTGLEGDISVPKGATDSSVGWIAGDGADSVSQSDPTFSAVTASPKTIGASTKGSRKALIQGDPSVEMLMRQSLIERIARGIDTAAINGSGTSNQPLGIIGQTGVDLATYANGGTPTFGNMVDMEGALLTDNAPMESLGYVTTGLMSATLKQTDIGTDTARFIWEAGNDGMGRVNGYRAMVSNLVPAGTILFGNWQSLVLCFWSAVDLIVDPYTEAAKGTLVITAMQDADVVVRHGEAFSVLSEAAP